MSRAAGPAAVASGSTLPERPRVNRPPRPAVPVFLALAGGILLDTLWPLPLTVWLSGAGLGFALAGCVTRGRNGWFAAGLVLAAWGFLGGLRHHLVQEMVPANDVSGWSREEPRLARVRGRIAGEVEILDAPVGPAIPSWMEIDRSQCPLEVEWLQQGGEWIRVSGRARLEVSGHLVQARPGDAVEVLGHLALPRAPLNPGSVDYREFLNRQGTRCLLRAEHPAAVSVLEGPRGGWWLLQVRERMRRKCQRLLATLPDEVRGVASSLLLGDRTLLTDELRERFAEGGVLHLLAISGLHVGILLGLLSLMLRSLKVSSRGMSTVLLCCLLWYVFLTNHRPPVLRASLLAGFTLVVTARGRRSDLINLLAVCALLLLLWSPADLFDVGAQLSFLAMGGIAWSLRRISSRELSDGVGDLSEERSPVVEGALGVWNFVRATWLVTAAVWGITLPLTMSVFHLVAPVGMLLNLLLIPVLGGILALGYLFLLGGLLLPAASPWLAWPFAVSLEWLQGVVGWGQRLGWGHFYVADLPNWWVVGFYAWLVLAVAALRRDRGQLLWRGLVVWVIVGLLLPWWPREQSRLRCTFLSVGHGLAVLLELPGGETVLYDGGTLGDGRRAERAIAGLLWQRGYRRLDAVIVSHADHDHYSGIFGLLEKIPVGSLLLAQPSLAADQPQILELCERASARRVRIQCVQAGDELVPSTGQEELLLEVLHPAGGFRSQADNANSVVLAVTYGGRRILLTGDLERDGLMALLQEEPQRADVLLAPHHGGRAANVPELFAWAAPEWVIVSSGEEEHPQLREVSRPARVLNTETAGAVTVEIDRAGKLQVSSHRMGEMETRENSEALVGRRSKSGPGVAIDAEEEMLATVEEDGRALRRHAEAFGNLLGTLILGADEAVYGVGIEVAEGPVAAGGGPFRRQTLFPVRAVEHVADFQQRMPGHFLGEDADLPDGLAAFFE